MKKTNPIRNLLGVSQEDMALILQVSRSQWAMYELGKRDLPTKAKLVLAEILHYVKTPEMFAKSLPQVEQQHVRKQQQLEHLLKENEYQQVLTSKKINFVERNMRLRLEHYKW
ncbi:helix-turn-helix domain-containing protein [Flavobacterium sp.]|uniref:helix-turn-helix domain-containing protein n=1 Tax=Flavobacterium sp. TaxID=239 RepID=UPI002487CF6F|nr:helix-turn-helix domain-containing protein [Flavobacterium sp.]MDI1318402.1 helix-turn-helix domain-containing protein [Flavobacterium sp.]